MSPIRAETTHPSARTWIWDWPTHPEVLGQSGSNLASQNHPERHKPRWRFIHRRSLQGMDSCPSGLREMGPLGFDTQGTCKQWVFKIYQREGDRVRIRLRAVFCLLMQYLPFMVMLFVISILMRMFDNNWSNFPSFKLSTMDIYILLLTYLMLPNGLPLQIFHLAIFSLSLLLHVPYFCLDCPFRGFHSSGTFYFLSFFVSNFCLDSLLRGFFPSETLQKVFLQLVQVDGFSKFVPL